MNGTHLAGATTFVRGPFCAKTFRITRSSGRIPLLLRVAGHQSWATTTSFRNQIVKIRVLPVLKPVRIRSQQKATRMSGPIKAAFRRTILVGVCVSPEELRTIDAHAKTAGLGRSPYLRQAGLKQNLRTRAEEEMARELIIIGQLLQQTPAKKRTSADVIGKINRIIDRLDKK